MYSAYKIHTPNLDLPISIVEVKGHLKYDEISQDDAQVEAFIMAATRSVEKTYGMAILTQTIKEYWSAFPCDEKKPMVLRIQPVSAVTAIEYMDENGTMQTWDSEEWTYGSYDLSTFIVPKLNFTWPTAAAMPNAITITYTAGFGSQPASVPSDIIQALKWIVADMDLRREDSVQALPRASENLLRPYYRFAA